MICGNIISETRRAPVIFLDSLSFCSLFAFHDIMIGGFLIYYTIGCMMYGSLGVTSGFWFATIDFRCTNPQKLHSFQ